MTIRLWAVLSLFLFRARARLNAKAEIREMLCWKRSGALNKPVGSEYYAREIGAG